jgi:hypothetical protein
MAEENQEKKKPSINKRIFEYIGLGLLTLLLIAAIYFQVPWKIITLILILLATSVSPKAYQKWFQRSVGLVLIVLIIWVFLPDDNEGWRPYTFDKELAAMEAKRVIPAEENAATIYNQLFENYDSNSFYKNFLIGDLENSILYEFWTRKDYPEVASWLEEHQNIINHLMLACEKNRCRFPIAGDFNAPELKPPCNFKEVTDFWWSPQSKRCIPMIHFGKLLICSANNDVAEGRVDQALEKYIANLQIAKHLYQQPIPMDMLVGMAIENRGLKQINEFLVTSNATDEYLLLLDKALQGIEHNWYSDSPKIFDSEKLMFKSFICAMFYQTNPDGRVRLNRDTRSTLSAQYGYILVSGKSTWEPINPDSYWQIKLTKAMTIFCWFFVPSTPEKTALIIDDIYKKYYTMTEPDFNWNDKLQFNLPSIMPNFRFLLEIFGQIMEQNYFFKIHDVYFKTVAQNRGSQLIIALRRYKNTNSAWPQSLNDIENTTASENLIDPISKSSFVYKLTEDNFTLYSKGKNNVDENGKNESPEKGGPDDLLIWPSRSSKTKEENSDVK